MKRFLTLVAAGVLLFAACGKENANTSDLTGGASSAPTASAMSEHSAAPGASADASGAPVTGGTASSAPAASSAVRTAPPTTRSAPAEGRANPPADGAYTYTYAGTASDPTNPAGPPQKFNGTLTNQISHSGSVYTSEVTNSENPGRTTTKTRHSSTKVELLSLKTETAAGDFSCTYNPPLVITKFPIKPETYPQQQMKGSGNACNGTLDITIVRKTTQADATGKSWSVWEVKVKTTLKSQQLTINQNETRFVSPELGVEVKSTGSSMGTYGPYKFTTNTTSTLKKHP